LIEEVVLIDGRVLTLTEEGFLLGRDTECFFKNIFKSVPIFSESSVRILIIRTLSSHLL
jgi:hypothetical protein